MDVIEVEEIPRIILEGVWVEGVKVQLNSKQQNRVENQSIEYEVLPASSCWKYQ